MFQRLFPPILIILAMLGLIAANVSEDVPATSAPVRQPAVQQSDVRWSVGALTFESLYPQGMRFSAEIRSNAGPITRGRVVWSHTPGTQRSRPIEIDPQTGLLTATWEATGADAVPPWVGLTYYWDVGDSAGNSFQTEPQTAEYADETRDWLRAESEDIIVFAQALSPEAAQYAIEAMAAQRETYREAWGGLLPYRPRAILFGSRAAWNEWQISAPLAGAIGVTSSDWGGTAQIVSGADYYDLAYGTVLHEVAHLYQHEFTFMMPGTWLIEGNATFFELAGRDSYEAYARALAANDTLPTLLEGTGPGVSGRTARRGYNIGYTFFAWLVENYGLEGHHQLIELLGQGVERNPAIEAVTGLSTAEVESRWRMWLGASPAAPTLVPTPTMRLFPTVTPYQFN